MPRRGRFNGRWGVPDGAARPRPEAALRLREDGVQIHDEGFRWPENLPPLHVEPPEVTTLALHGI